MTSAFCASTWLIPLANDVSHGPDQADIGEQQGTKAEENTPHMISKGYDKSNPPIVAMLLAIITKVRESTGCSMRRCGITW